jgi:hypothetical protein
MANELCGPDVMFRYGLVDMRSLDGERLLESPDIGDNVIAILAGLQDYRDAVRRIVTRTARLPEAARERALRLLLTISGLRKLEEVVEREVERMPIYIDIMENKVLGREYKRGLQEGELTIVRRLLEKRFGSLPAWAEEKLIKKSSAELEEPSLRVLDANSLAELLP